MRNGKQVKEYRQAPKTGAKILLLDIETAPILAHVWGLWENNVALNQVVKDAHLLSWSAKWLGSPANEIMYMDQRNAADMEDDRKLCKGIWKLMDEADILITQNGVAFDQKRLYARFVQHGMKPPTSCKQIDTFLLAKKHFGFTSNKLEYLTDKLCTKYKKLKHKKFPSFELWRECLANNIEAWDEMEKYNKHDVLALEELYLKLSPWDQSINFALYSDKDDHICSCGSTELCKNGYAYTSLGKYQRYSCTSCGAEVRANANLIDKEKRDALKRRVSR